MIRRRQETNPRRLRKQIYDMIRYIFSLPGAVPGQSDDVRLTLLTSPQKPVESERLAADLFWSLDGRQPAQPRQLNSLASDKGG